MTMEFSTNLFLFFFFPITLAGYYLLKESYRNFFLAFASCVFYYWGGRNTILILALLILLNYAGGLLLAWAGQQRRLRMAVLTIFILVNLSALFFYKYDSFARLTINHIFGSDLAIRQIALPLGISFFTFQGLSYLIDLYRGQIEAQRNPLKLALYFLLFPKLLSGPIVRYKDIEAQLTSRQYSAEVFWGGAKRFIYGLAKKVLIANQLALIVDPIFAKPASEHTVLVAWAGALCYTLQIYYDFSGYSDIAIGLGRMFGFKFQENFNFPYISSSVKEFWRRWHISLSSWFRDYLYIPLGGSRKGNTYLNLVIVFLATGLWHGASWNFIVWGMWYGVFLISERIVEKRWPNIIIPRIIGTLYTLLVVVVGWVFFRAPDLGYAANYISTMFGFRESVLLAYPIDLYFTLKTLCVFLCAIVLSMPLKQAVKVRLGDKTASPVVSIGETVLLLALFILSVVYIQSSGSTPSIYFRF